MSNADTLLRSGDLDGARAALVETVRAEPANQQARMFLFQLLALAGEWDKARRQLQTLAQLSPEAQMLAVAYGQAIDAEVEREAVFAGSERARQHVASDWAEGVVEAIFHFANDRIAEGDTARVTAFDAAPDMPGTFNETGFEWIGDADSRFGPCLEMIIGGRYGLQPLDQVVRITAEGPRDLRDVIWYPVQIAFRNGQSVAGFIPTRYPGSERAAEVSERLARGTSWADAGWGQAGSGQRLLTLSDGEDHGILSLRSLSLG